MAKKLVFQPVGYEDVRCGGAVRIDAAAQCEVTRIMRATGLSGCKVASTLILYAAKNCVIRRPDGSGQPYEVVEVDE